MKVSAVAVAGFLVLAFAPHQVAAKDIHLQSIELIAAESDAMVRGTIVEIKHLEPERADYYPYRFKLAIHVTETLRGPKTDAISVTVEGFNPKFDAWRKQSTELLFSLQNWVGPDPPCRFALRPGLSSIIELDGNGPGVVTMDFRVLTERAEILKAARGAVAAVHDGGEKKRHRLLPPSSADVTIKLGTEFSVMYVWMPVDQRLEERGQGWARSRSVDYRALAPEALRPFKSDKNIAILKGLLADHWHRDFIDAKGKGTRVYPARLPAYVVLKHWGVKVEKPVTEVPVRGIEDVASVDKPVF
jgi:hypothetical protein